MAVIWRYERKIAEDCAQLLNTALARLDCDITPCVFLVGVNCSTDEVVVIPESAAIKPEDFIDELDSFVDNNVCHPEYALLDEDWDKEFRRFSDHCWTCWEQLRNAVNAIVTPKGLLASVSPCFHINGHMVSLVITYSCERYEQYPHMDMTVFKEHGRWPALHFGLVEAVLHEFGEELRKQDAGRRRIETVEHIRLLRVTAEFFTRCNVWARKRFSQIDIHFRGTLDFFEVCNTISAMPYESRQGFGGMIVADIGHAAIDTVLSTHFPVLADNHRRVRKLIEMCQSGLFVLTDSRYVWGLGKFDQSRYEASNADVMRIRFHGHGRWVLSHLETELMDVRQGEPRLPRSAVKPSVIRGRLTATFGEDANLDRLCEAVQHSINAKHGALLVISSAAAAENKRLSGRQGGFRPFETSVETITAGIAIDGAIMLDPQGQGHGIGLILDGEAGEQEDPARGARYNSAIRYLRRCEQHQIQCLIVVVSEDGIVTVLPKQ
jgi:hypothetical protein